MSATPSKMFAGFIGFIISVCLFAGAGTAEQIAETESHVVLEVGTRGILPCRIQTKAHLVQWTRHLISEHLLVYLDPYSNVGRRGGPGYKAELFNISVDYSLVIKNVKVRDQGLYICEVSDFQTGKVIRNRTRVSVQGHGIGTAAHVVLEMGARGILPCRIQWRAYTVKWKRQLTSETELLVSLDTYFDTGARDGQGYKAGLFNITEDYSLVIKDVKVEDEGLYFCTFSDYKTGKVFRNGTRVSVQASPSEPFPVIQECIGRYVHPSACTLTVDSTSKLTCLVEGYYPDIDLFFQHGSEKLTSIEYEEWENADGTKNKNITIRISASDETYQCVASRLPGIARNKSVSVKLLAHSQGSIAVKIVVPVFLVLGLSIAAIFKFYPRKCRAPEGPVSKYELWKLVTKAKDKNAFEKLKKALRRLRQLSKTEALKLKKNNDFYESLCKWKSETSSISNQRIKLYSVCCEVGMSDIIRELTDFVWDTTYEVSRADIDHILGELDTSKIIELLKALQLDHEAVVTASQKGRREMINMARKELLMWRHVAFEINPVVALCLNLDNLHCETNFFKIKLSQKEEIDEEEMKDICYKISKQHCLHLLRAIGGKCHGEELRDEIKRIVNANNISLFNTLQMLHDWIQSKECSSYEKRGELKKAIDAVLLRDHTDAKWPPDGDLRAIASFLSPVSMEELSSTLGIESPPQESNEDERCHALAEWRDSHASSKDLKEKHSELFTALKKVKREGLIPRVKGHLVYKAELVDLALHLFAQDLLPFTEALGISAAKLVAYKPTFQPSHLKQGTIRLVCKLFESGERSRFFEQIKKIPYPNVLASGMLALEIGFGEVSAISVSPAYCQKLIKRMQPSLTKSTSMSHEDHHSLTGNIKEVQSQNEICNETITTMLTSAVQVEDHDQVSPESLAFLKIFEVWREQPRLIPFNFRLALAYYLRSEKNYDQISDFLRGEHNEGKIPFTFFDNILRTMDPNQRCILGNLIRDAPFSPVTSRVSIYPLKEEEWFRLEDKVIRSMHAWTDEYILQITETKWQEGKEIAREHQEFNNKLLEYGFFDLAREIMIRERQVVESLGDYDPTLIATEDM